MDTPATRLTLLAMLRAESVHEHAWREFVRRYGPKIAEWSRRQGLNEADVEELTQTVIVQLFQARSFRYDQRRGRFRAYLFTVTKRAVARWRRTKSRLAAGNGRRLFDISAADDLLARLENDFDLEHFRAALLTVRSRVQETTWAAFEFTELNGRKAAEVAAELNLTIAAVNVYRSRIRAMVRKEVEFMQQ